jgi:hypothetical protein
VSNDNDDITPLLAAKSDQLNADDLIAGPVTVRVISARITGGMEQPVTVELDGGHRPWKPCKTTMRVLAALWGSAPSAWAGRLVRLYRDPTVKYGGVEVGGIRISGMSHIDGPKKITLAASKKSKVEHRIDVLRDEPKRPQPRAVQQDDAPAPGVDDYRASVRAVLREMGCDLVGFLEFCEAKTGKSPGPPETWNERTAKYLAGKVRGEWAAGLRTYLAPPPPVDDDNPFDGDAA